MLSDIWALFAEVDYAWSEGDLTNGKKLNIIPVIPSAKHFNIPDLISGSTIVAMGTSMPEFSFDVQSALAVTLTLLRAIDKLSASVSRHSSQNSL